MIEHMEEVINRELTPKEKRFVEWLSGWPETIDTLNALLDAFYKAGQADTLEQQQREIDQLKQVMDFASDLLLHDHKVYRILQDALSPNKEVSIYASTHRAHSNGL